MTQSILLVVLDETPANSPLQTEAWYADILQFNAICNSATNDHRGAAIIVLNEQGAHVQDHQHASHQHPRCEAQGKWRSATSTNDQVATSCGTFGLDIKSIFVKQKVQDMVGWIMFLPGVVYAYVAISLGTICKNPYSIRSIFCAWLFFPMPLALVNALVSTTCTALTSFQYAFCVKRKVHPLFHNTTHTFHNINHPFHLPPHPFHQTWGGGGG